MAIDEINKAINGLNRFIFKICATAIIIILIVIAGSCINSKNQSDTLKYYIEQSYNYEYPDIENTNISGNENNIQGDD